MKNIFLISLLVLISSLIIGCAPSVEKTNTTISLSALVAGPTSYPGGLIVMAYSKQLDKHYLQPVLKNEISFDLPNGDWKFAAVGWSGGNALSGDTFCDQKSAFLGGGEVVIDLNLSQAGCSGEVFGKADRKNGPEIRKLKIVNCALGPSTDNSINNFNGDYDCADNPGKYKSYKVFVHGFIDARENDFFAKKHEFLESTCIDVSGTTSASAPAADDISLAIPENAPFTIRSYNNAACAGLAKTTHFEKGMNHGIPYPNNEAFVKNGSDSVTAYIRSDICADGYEVASNPSDFGLTNAIQYICNETQFGKIDTDFNTRGYDYMLAGPIDFGNDGDNSIIGGAFTGTLDGQGHRLYNFTKTASTSQHSGLFWTVEGDAEITNLVIDDFDLNVSGSANTVHGILASNVNATASKKIKFKNITLKNSTFFTNMDSTGGLLGSIYISASNASVRADDITIENVNITSMSENVDNMGLLVGYANNSLSEPAEQLQLDGITIKNSKILLNTNTITLGKYHGGVAGLFQNGIIKNTYLTNIEIEGNQSVGGIVGIAKGAFQITNTKTFNTRVIGTHASSSNSSMGGIAGEVDFGSGSPLGQIRSNFIEKYELELETPGTAFISNSGGLIGNVTGISASTLHIFNNKSIVEMNINGDRFGGILGATDSGGSVSTGIEIVGNIAYTKMNTESISTDNNLRAGIAGVLQTTSAATKIYQNMAFPIIEGADQLGGITAQSNCSINENYAEIDIKQSIASSGATDIELGGIASNLSTGSGIQIQFNQILGKLTSALNIQCDSSNSTPPGSPFDNCGLLIGNIVNSTASISKNYILIDFDSNDTSDIAFTYGKTSTPVPTGTESDSITNHFAVPAWKFDLGADRIYELTFMHKMRKMPGAIINMGIDIDGDTTADFDDYIIGNTREPISISSEEAWNQVADNEYMLEKSYELSAPLDFGQNKLNFIPFGGKGTSTAHFVGNFYNPGNFVMRGIRMDSNDYSSVTALGIFRYVNTTGLATTVIGTPESPILVEDLEISVTGNNLSSTGSIGGLVLNTEISARVLDSRIVSNGGALVTLGVGGIIGAVLGANKHFSLKNSLFKGEIIDSGLNRFTYVGGLIGSIQQGSNSETEIKYSSARLKNLEGKDYVGGLIGQFTPGTSNTISSVVSNSVLFEAGSSISSSTTNLFGLMAEYTAAQTPHFHSNYVDIAGLSSPPSSTKYITDTGNTSGGGGTKNFVVTGSHLKSGNLNHVESTGFYSNHFEMVEDELSTSPLFNSTDHDFIFDGIFVKHIWE